MVYNKELCKDTEYKDHRYQFHFIKSYQNIKINMK